VANSAQGAISYLLIQGEFDGASAGLETYKWKVVYNSSLQITGLDIDEQNTGLALLAAVFGNGSKSASGIYGNTTNQVDISFGFLNSFTLGGIQVFSGPNYPLDPQWGYLNAGGSFIDTFSFPIVTGNYANGSWLGANTGILGRQLADGSYDAWTNGVLVDTFTVDSGGFKIYNPHPVTGSGNSPALGDFSGIETSLYSTSNYTVYSIASAPEPSRSMLLLLAGAAFVTRRRRSSSALR
jgi:hypothetical protein